MEVEFTSEARKDLFEAADYYEAKEKGLGERIRGEVADILRAVSGAPCSSSQRLFSAWCTIEFRLIRIHQLGFRRRKPQISMA